MELTKDHRQALITELITAREDWQLRCSMLKKCDLIDKDWIEIAHFLATERIKLIEKSLIDNEIDY